MSHFFSNKKSKNAELVAAALCDFIFMRTSKDIAELEHNEQFKEIAIEFNNLPPLKRLLDIWIMYFWLVSIECQWHYEKEDFNKICKMIEDNIYERLEYHEKSDHIHSLTLKDFVKDPQELEAFYSEYPVSDQTKVNFRVLLSILIPRRFLNYNSTLSYEDQSQGFLGRVLSFCQHVFGSDKSTFNGLLIFPSIFTAMSISSMEFIKEVESKDIQDIKKEERKE